MTSTEGANAGHSATVSTTLDSVGANSSEAPNELGAPSSPSSNGDRGDSSEVNQNSDGYPTEEGQESDVDAADAGTVSSAPSSEDAASSGGAGIPALPSLPVESGADYATARGGARLGAVHYTAPGVEQFLHFYDHELETECAFEKLEGRSDYACAPPVSVDVQYLDAECTQPIVLSGQDRIAAPRPNDGNPDLVAVPEGFVGSLVTVRKREVDCSTLRVLNASGVEAKAAGSDLPLLGEVHAVYQVTGDRITLPPDASSSVSTVYTLDDGECKSTLAMIRIRQLADSAYPLELRQVDDLVVAEVQSFDVGPHFGVQRLIGSDGSWQTLGALDHAQESCEVLADGRCVPSPVEPLDNVSLFADWPCAGELVDVPVSASSDCGGQYGVLKSGGEIQVFDLVPSASSGYYTQQERFNPDTGETLGLECGGLYGFQVGKSLTEREFPTAEVALTGTPELRARRPVTHHLESFVALSPGVELVLPDESVCQVTLFDDGVYRCHTETPGVIDAVTYLPENRALPFGIFSDDACANEIYVEQYGANPDAPFWNLTTSFHALVPFDGVIHEYQNGVCYPVPDTTIDSRTFVESAQLPVALPVVEKAER